MCRPISASAWASPARRPVSGKVGTGFTPARRMGLASGRFGAHIRGMMIEQFNCPKCGMWYEVTRGQLPEPPRPGSFKCTVCDTEVHSWFGVDRYDDWRQITMRSPGERS
jgi:hypothetical protein